MKARYECLYNTVVLSPDFHCVSNSARRILTTKWVAQPFVEATQSLDVKKDLGPSTNLTPLVSKTLNTLSALNWSGCGNRAAATRSKASCSAVEHGRFPDPTRTITIQP